MNRLVCSNQYWYVLSWCICFRQDWYVKWYSGRQCEFNIYRPTQAIRTIISNTYNTSKYIFMHTNTNNTNTYIWYITVHKITSQYKQYIPIYSTCEYMQYAPIQVINTTCNTQYAPIQATHTNTNHTCQYIPQIHINTHQYKYKQSLQYTLIHTIQANTMKYIPIYNSYKYMRIIANTYEYMP